MTVAAGLKRIVLTPLHVLQLATSAKSFLDHPLIADTNPPAFTSALRNHATRELTPAETEATTLTRNATAQPVPRTKSHIFRSMARNTKLPNAGLVGAPWGRWRLGICWNLRVVSLTKSSTSSGGMGNWRETSRTISSFTDGKNE